ncbi:TBC1 domain family member 2B-like [Patella vulgata]|uniref:TBC1 domain family member 2B-like n=1 Tax=Patella vulgata TaxID=6465 RepID=UPI0024A81193|nr:TBC1 domain family member 2B-like [Patella vulgata]
MESSRGVSVFYCDWDSAEADTKENEMNETSVKTGTDKMSTSTTNVSNELTCDTQQASASASTNKFSDSDSDRSGQQGQGETLRLCGWLSKQGTVGFVKTNRLYWFVFGDDTCKLYYYRNRNDLLPQGEIDISKASFSYNVNKEKLQDGVLEIRSEGKTHYLDAQDRSKMIYWLQELQRKRREYSQKRTSLSTERMQVTIKKQQQAGGLLRSKPAVTDDRMKSTDGTIPNLVFPGDEVEEDRITSPMKPTSFSSGLKTEILNVISSIKTQSPSTPERHSPPASPRSGSSSEEWSLLEPDPVFPSNQTTTSSNIQSPNSSKSQTNFLNTLKRMKIGKRTSSDGNIKVQATAVCVRCKHLYEENVLLKEDLKATEEELKAHREIVKLLQKELDTKATIANTSSESVGKEEGELLDMLKERDKHIVELEHCLSLVQEEKSMSVQQTR